MPTLELVLKKAHILKNQKPDPEFDKSSTF